MIVYCILGEKLQNKNDAEIKHSYCNDQIFFRNLNNNFDGGLYPIDTISYGVQDRI